MDFSWIDIVIVAIFLISAVRGLVQGFVKSFLSFALIIASLVVAKIFSPQLALYFMEHGTWTQKLTAFIQQKVVALFGGNINSVNWADSTQLHNAPSALQQYLESFISSANKTIGSLADAFASNAASLIVNIISFLLIFIVMMIIGKLLIAVIDKMSQLPVLKVFNRAGGLLVGIVKGIIVICIFSTLIYYANLMLGIVELSTAINNSFLIKYFYIGFLFS